MKLLVVIVNYKTSDLTVNCLESLTPEIAAIDDARIVVTDNASQDGSVETIQSAIERNGWSWASLASLSKNGGFAWGNNQGIEPYLRLDPAERPQYIYLLNPDTLVLPGAITELVQFLDAHPDVGIAGGRAVNQDGSVRMSAFRFHSPLSELEGSIRLGVVTWMLKNHVVAQTPPDEPARCDWVSGASLMIRREVLEKIGLLDDRYFMYYEETDFCLRAARSGWTTWYVPASRIIHLVGQSSGVTGAKRMVKRRPRYWFDSRHRFFRQNHGAVKTLLADMLFATGLTGYGVLRVVRRRPRVDPPWLLWDFVRYNLMSWTHRA